MPVFNASLTTIDEKETRRYAGLMKAADFPQHLIQDACDEARMLVQPKGIWQLYDYNQEASRIEAPFPYLLTGAKIIAYLKEAKKTAVLAVTIGEALENSISEHFAKGNYTYALLLDAAGTTAVEMAADQLSKAVEQQANKMGFTTLARFSPGYGDWEITEQPQVLKLAAGQTVGIEVTDSCMLLPRKSVTAVIGFIPFRKSASCKEVRCTGCTQQNCLARKDEPT